MRRPERIHRKREEDSDWGCRDDSVSVRRVLDWCPTASAPTPVSVSNPTVAPAASGAQVGEGDVRKVGDALLAVNSFSMHGQLKEDDGSAVDWKMDFVKPDRQHTRITTAGRRSRASPSVRRITSRLGVPGRRAASARTRRVQLVPLSNPDDLAKSFKDSTSMATRWSRAPWTRSTARSARNGRSPRGTASKPMPASADR